MPNHFHLLVKQKEHDAITQLIRRICTAYSMVFNQRRHRVGTLFQGRYKAVLIESEEQFLYLTKYIHRNPLPIAKDRPVQLTDYPYLLDNDTL